MEGPSDIRGAAQPPHSPGAPIQLTPAGTPAFEGLCSTDRRGEPAPHFSEGETEAEEGGDRSGVPQRGPGSPAGRPCGPRPEALAPRSVMPAPAAVSSGP